MKWGQAPKTSGVTGSLNLPERLPLKLARFDLCSLGALEPGQAGADSSAAPESRPWRSGLFQAQAGRELAQACPS